MMETRKHILILKIKEHKITFYVFERNDGEELSHIRVYPKQEHWARSQSFTLELYSGVVRDGKQKIPIPVGKVYEQKIGVASVF